MLHFYSSSNRKVNSSKAIQSCISESTDYKDLSKCVLIVIHATIGHNFKDILETAKQSCPSAVVVGCTCAGIIGREGPKEDMRSLAVMMVYADNRDLLHIVSRPNITGLNSFEVASEMAEELKSKSQNINMVQLYGSGIDVAADQIILGIESIFGSETPIFGGTSSDNMKAITSFQFFENEVLEKGVVMIGFADPSLNVEMAVHHGSVPVGIGFEVTKSIKNKVLEIENVPAWNYIMDALGLPHDTHPGPCIPTAGLGELLTEDLHEEYDNKHILRVVTKVDSDGSFYMPVNCPEGTRLWLTKRNEDLIFNGLDRMLNKLSDRLKGKEVVAVIHTDCAARGRAMFDEINKEEIINKMQKSICKEIIKPWLGMYGYGEFTLLGGRNRFHNYTTSLYVLTRENV